MLLDHRTREEKMSSFSPWKRRRDDVWGRGCVSIPINSFNEKFSNSANANIDLGIDTKRSLLKVSASVVSVVSIKGQKPLFTGSGIIIACEDVDGAYVSTILTSGSILKSPAVADDIKVFVYLFGGKLFEGQVVFYDCHYNISTVKIESDSPLPTASLRLVDDSISVDPYEIPCPGEKDVISESYQFCQLSPGDLVIAIGRYFKNDFELMAAPGIFSLDACNFDCKELFRASCKISKCGIGGPLINRFGEVIGVNFYDQPCTPFLPINIACKCLEYFEKYRRFCRPWLGIEATNLYAASVSTKEKIIQKFPNIFKGVIVAKVIPGSSAQCAGLHPDDVIIQCDGNLVRGFLEFFGMICDKAAHKKKKKRSMKLVVLRGKSGARVRITIAVDEATPDKFYRWPLPKKSSMPVETY